MSESPELWALLIIAIIVIGTVFVYLPSIGVDLFQLLGV